MEGNIYSHLFRKTLGNWVFKLNNYSNESVILLMELFGHSSPANTKNNWELRKGKSTMCMTKLGFKEHLYKIAPQD